jgi:CRISPR-associated endonuclease/helicase Cas3
MDAYFLPQSNRDKSVSLAEGTVYLVCTSAGEVGVNISADHMVCDLSTFESMTQRFGRVNRFGDCPDTRIDVVYPAELPSERDIAAELKKEEAKQSGKTLVDGHRRRTLDLLRTLNNGSPASLGNLDPDARLAAYSPAPKLLDTSDILFDAWALSTIRDKLAGRPIVEPYLHGEASWQPPETHVGWREESAMLGEGRLSERQLRELFDEYPPKQHELLRDQTQRVFDELEAIAGRVPALSAWVIDADGEGKSFALSDLVKRNKQKKPAVDLSNCTVLLPPKAGGRDVGMLNGRIEYLETEEDDYDVAGQPSTASVDPMIRIVVTSDDGELVFKPAAKTNGLVNFAPRLNFELKEIERARQLRKALQDAGIPSMRAALRFDLKDTDDEGGGPVQFVVMKPEREPKRLTRPEEWPALDVHREGVRAHARAICDRLGLPEAIAQAVELAAKWHDLGKGRGVWQRGAGNHPGQLPVSKPIHGRPPENLNGFRHELASLVDVHSVPQVFGEFERLEPAERELTLHLIAAHHGRARPHFPVEESTDPERPDIASTSVAADTPARFAHLQREFGRWGLAYLESLIRAADILDSQRIEVTPISDPEAGEWPKRPSKFVWPAKSPHPEPTIHVTVDPANPGQFFACCGLLELADRLWPGAEAYFVDKEFRIVCNGELKDLIYAITSAELTQLDLDDDKGTGKDSVFAREGFKDNPATGAPGGVIARGDIRRDMTINLSAIRRLRVPQADNLVSDDVERTLKVRRYILGLALLAATVRNEDRYNLREGCQLRQKPGHNANWREVRYEGGDSDLTGLTEETVAEYARLAAEAFGVGDSREVLFDQKTAEKWLKLDKKQQDKLRRDNPMTKQFTEESSEGDPTAEPVTKPTRRPRNPGKGGN